MKLFKKIARAAGATAKKEKAGAAAATEAEQEEEGALTAKGASVAAPAAPHAKDAAPSTSSYKTPADAEDKKDAVIGAEEEVRLRAKYEVLYKENKDLKQRNGFLLQMLAASQLDERMLELEVEQRQQTLSPGASIASPVLRR